MCSVPPSYARYAPPLPQPAVASPAMPLNTLSVAETSYFTPQLRPQANVEDGSVRDPALAQQTIARLKAATAQISTPAQAAAAGYKPNPSAPDHWINDEVFSARNGYDLTRPATLMFEGDQLVGVMLSHDPKQGAPPDLGAGSWHTHAGTANAEYASHVWFTKPLATAFGTEVGDV